MDQSYREPKVLLSYLYTVIDIFDLCIFGTKMACSDIFYLFFLFWLSFCPCNLTKYVPTTFGYATIELLRDGGRSENFRGEGCSNRSSFDGTGFDSKILQNMVG